MAGIKTAKLLIIGDEILMGQTVDTNSAWIGRELNDLGVEVEEVLTVKDTKESILNGLTSVSRASDLVLVSGGLGPTEDDITKDSITDFFEDRLEFDEDTYRHIKEFLSSLDREPTSLHKQQAYMPQKAELLHNDKGTAPGMKFEKEGKLYIFLPGVPYEMKSMMKREVLPMIEDRKAANVVKHLTLQTFGLGESEVAERIKDITDGLPEGLSVAFLPHLGRVRVRVTARGDDEDKIGNRLEGVRQQLKDRLGDYIFAFGQRELHAAIGDVLKDKGLNMSCAESCTGGSVAAKITSVAGASEYFIGGVVSYADSVKMAVLEVEESTLKEKGAVSEECAIQMVKGACRAFGSDVALATTGVAGPGGGSAEKPVGTIWIAAGNSEEVRTKKLQLGQDRELNIKMGGDAALNLLRLFLSGS